MHYNLQSRADHHDPLTGYTDMIFCSSDPDFDPIALTYELDRKILKMYLHAKNELSGSRFSKVKSITDTQTDATENIIMPQALAVTNHY